MNKRLLIIFVLFFSIDLHAANFNGYIAKYKATKHLAKLFRNNKTITTTFGSYALITDQQKSALRKNSNIEYIEPNYLYSLQGSFSDPTIRDPKFKKQWALNNTGKNSTSYIFFPGEVGEDVNAIEAWKITTGSNDIKIAILDSGVDYNHPDLKNNLWTNQLELTGVPGVDDDGNGYIDDIYGYDFVNGDGDPFDGHGHGTHCAGVIGAVHNDIGIRGIMSKVKMISLKFMNDKGIGETIHAIAAIDYAIKAGAQIMSNSWGGDDKSQAMKDAIIAARNEGILFVVAAGNSKYGHDNDSGPIYPANYQVDNVISVGASNFFGNRAIFSNSGAKTVHIFAPGLKIISTMPKGRYKKMDGTSMAAPLVAGALGLLLSHQEGISYKEAKTKLLDSAFRLRLPSSTCISGRLDVLEMLNTP